MKRWITASVAGFAMGMGLAVWASQEPPRPAPPAPEAPVVSAAAAAQGPNLSDAERDRLQKELQELEEQRAKTDARIRELRRRLGRSPGALVVPPRVFVGPDRLDPERRKAVEEALEKAQRAMADALKDLPDRLVVPDVEALTDRALRLYALPESRISPEDRAKLEQERSRLRQELLRRRPDARAFQFDRNELRATPPDVRKELEQARQELERARKELEKAREEMRRERERRPL